MSAYLDVRLSAQSRKFLEKKEEENEYFNLVGDDRDEILLQACNITVGD